MHPNSTQQLPVVRRATTADVPALFAIRTSVRENHLSIEQLAERGVTPATVAASVTDDAWRTWVVEDGGTIHGFSMADARTGCVFALFVSPAAEGRGVGRALLAEAERWLFSDGRDVIWLETAEAPGNRAHRIYRRAGWVAVGPADHGDVRYEKRRGTGKVP